MTQHTTTGSDATAARVARDAVEGFFKVLADDWATNDGAAVANSFVDDGSLINPFGERADGRSAIAAMYCEYFAGMLRGTTTAVQVEAIRSIHGDGAFADSRQTIYGPNGSVVLVVHLSSLLHHGGDGWRVVDARPYTFPAPPAQD
jgi:uncharacterized protein (TIGR02246 family)